MTGMTDDMIDAALERGRLAQTHECRAAKATYDRHSRHVVVELTNGCVFAFPSALVEVLRAADDDQIAAVEILGPGYGLHWEALDLDLSLTGLMAGALGRGERKAPNVFASARPWRP